MKEYSDDTQLYQNVKSTSFFEVIKQIQVMFFSKNNHRIFNRSMDVFGLKVLYFAFFFKKTFLFTPTMVAYLNIFFF